MALHTLSLGGARNYLQCPTWGSMQPRPMCNATSNGGANYSLQLT